MQRFQTPSFVLRTGFAFVLATCLIASILPRITQAAGGSKQLQRVKGTVGYATDPDASDFKTVFAKFDLPDDDYAVTRVQSAAVLALPDSSLISLGENTDVKVSAFDSVSASPGATITVNNGSLRFDIRRPEGGQANYHFQTATSQVAVRGTVGLLSFINGVTTVGCVACAADSVAVTIGTNTVTLVTGQFITISALGAVTTGALGSAVGAFTGAGVPVTANVGAAAAGIPAAGGLAAGVVVPAVAGAAVAGTAIGIANSSHTPAPQSTNSGGTVVGPTTSPTPVGTPTGTVNLTGHAVAAPTAAPHPPAAAPLAPPPPPGAPGLSGRHSR
jgi:hypothetical protein